MKIEKKYPGLCQEKTPAGNPRWRVRVEGQKAKKITLTVTPDHGDFDKHYEAAREGRKLALEKPEKPAKGSLDEMIEDYLAWLEVQVAAGNLSAATLQSRTTGLTQARNFLSPNKKHRIGAMGADLPRAAFAHIRDSFGERTGAGHTCLKALRALYAWGEDKGYPADSPVFRVKSHHVPKGGATPWTSKDEKKFLERHGPGTMARRWFFLARNMAGRVGDTFDIGPGNIELDGNRAYLVWQPKKKGSKSVKVPLLPELADELAVGLTHDDAFLVSERGKPFASENSLGNRIAKWVVQAGLCLEVEVTDKKTGETRKEMRATRSQHGVRKATANELAESGASVYEIAARLSHTDFKSSAPYTRDVDRARLAEAGFDRAEQARRDRTAS
ncbi:tyrosine-type recombinase/integrase [Roseivivax marinus]|uniref:tyrosine-type recombinase/integrase n=1 Tax=Roseivivax marinus TaxID=1379903 RepID=UPI00273ECA18|nr:tyrosine-type recombinase/integrase [Roseivivax marinus]